MHNTIPYQIHIIHFEFYLSFALLCFSSYFLREPRTPKRDASMLLCDEKNFRLVLYGRTVTVTVILYGDSNLKKNC
jgi:hypothetical protein